MSRLGVMLVERDAKTLEAFRAAAVEPWLRLEIATGAGEAITRVPREQPDLIAVARELADGAALASLRSVAGEDARIVLIVAPEQAHTVEADDADDVLVRPLHVERVRVCLIAAQRLQRLRQDLQACRNALDDAREELARALAERIALLEAMLDMRRPGTSLRGRRAADAALALCERLGIPPEFRPDLERAARLHEVGRLIVDDANLEPGEEPWRRALAGRAILGRVPGLEGAAELLGGMSENWDGTGMPDHLQHGQVPLRCRILRVLADAYAMLDRPGGTLERTLRWLGEHAGTFYDPMVAVHVQTLIGGAAGSDDRAVVGVDELRAGMVLDEDLYTDNGIKLLASGTELSVATLETILRRHRAEPLMHGAVVRRAA